MLPSLTRLSIHVAPVAMDHEPPKQQPRGDGSDEPKSLPYLPPEVYVSIVANMMRGAPNKACEDLYNLCLTGKLPCGLMDSKVQREQVFKAACVHLFGVVDDKAVLGAHSPWGTFRNWQELFRMLCFAFSPNGFEAMSVLWGTLRGQLFFGAPNPYYGGAQRGTPTYDAGPAMWSDVHTILLNHRPESQPVVVRRATERMLDDVLVRFLRAYGLSTAAWIGTVRDAQGPFVMDRLMQAYQGMQEELLSMRWATPSAALCWLLVNRGARLERMIEQSMLRFRTVAVPEMTPTPRYYEIVDDELRQRITRGEDSDFDETIAEITRLRALGAVFDPLDQGPEAVSQRGASIFLVLLGFVPDLVEGRIRYRLLNWLFEQEGAIRDEVYPPFGAVVRLAMMQDQNLLTGGGPSNKIWVELVKAVYKDRAPAFKRSKQLRSIFFGLLGHIPGVREFLGPEGPLGNTDERIWDPLVNMHGIGPDEDTDDITEYMLHDDADLYGDGILESDYEVRSAREWMRIFSERPPTPRRVPPARMWPNRVWSPEQNRWIMTKVLMSDSDEEEEAELFGEDEYDDLADDDPEVGAQDPTAPF